MLSLWPSSPAFAQNPLVTCVSEGLSGTTPSADLEKMKNARAAARKNRLPAATYQLLDLSVLNPEGSLISKPRLDQSIASPITDVDEIRARQGAVDEIYQSASDASAKSDGLMKNLAGIYESKESQNWRDALNRTTDDGAPEIFDIYPTEFQLRMERDKATKSTLDAAGRIGIARQQFFSEIKQLSATLSHATSPRLRSIRWAFERCFDETDPNSPLDFIKNHGKETDVRVTSQSVDNIRTSSKNPQYRLTEASPEEVKKEAEIYDRIQRAADAYAELGLYFDVASHDRRSGFETTPTILDPSLHQSPVFTIVDGYPMAELRKSKAKPGSSEPVANSLRLTTQSNQKVYTGGAGNGKTTQLRMPAQYLVWSSLGGHVPARQVELTPVEFNSYIRPHDSPRDSQSQFQAEVAQFTRTIIDGLKKNPKQFIFMDEPLSGAPVPARSAVEAVALQWIHDLGGASFVSTTNPDTARALRMIQSGVLDHWQAPSTKKSEDAVDLHNIGPFEVLHLDQDHHVQPGSEQDMKSIVDSVVRATEMAGWPEKYQTLLRKVFAVMEGDDQ